MDYSKRGYFYQLYFDKNTTNHSSLGLKMTGWTLVGYTAGILIGGMVPLTMMGLIYGGYNGLKEEESIYKKRTEKMRHAYDLLLKIRPDLQTLSYTEFKAVCNSDEIRSIVCDICNQIEYY